MIYDIGAASPLISVILPTFNREKLLANAIASVKGQSFTDWELIVVDDGSRDATYDVVKGICGGDARCRYHFTTNRGLAMARNIGLSIGRGEYYTFLDSDDAYLPDHLAIRAEYVRAHPDVELLHGGVEVIGPDMVADKFNPSRMIPISECVVGGTFVIRRDLAERLEGFGRVLYGDDNEFFARAVELNAVIHKIDAPTYRYNRTTEDSLCAIMEREGMEGLMKRRTHS